MRNILPPSRSVVKNRGYDLGTGGSSDAETESTVTSRHMTPSSSFTRHDRPKVLTLIFFFPFRKKFPPGKSMTPGRGIAIFFRSSQQLSRLFHGPHLAKRPSDLKQNGAQEKAPFSGRVFHILSHALVASVSFKNH